MKKSINNNASLLGKLGFALVLGLGISLSACKKDDDDVNGGNNSGSTPTLGAGTLVAVKSQTVQSTPIGDMTIDIGTAVAVFGADAGWSSFVDGGTVKVNDNALSKMPNSSYVFTPGVASPTGIDFGSSITWSVAGNSSTGVPAFDHTVTGGFPSVGSVNVDDNVSKAAGLTVPISGVSNADSLYINVNEVVKVLPASATSANFSSADLSSLSNGQGIVSIAAVKYTNQAYGGKTFYFLNQAVKQKSVTIGN